MGPAGQATAIFVSGAIVGVTMTTIFGAGSIIGIAVGVAVMAFSISDDPEKPKKTGDDSTAKPALAERSEEAARRSSIKATIEHPKISGSLNRNRPGCK